MRLVLALTLIAACASSGGYVPTGSAPASLVIVRNDRLDDAWIYVERGGSKTRRLGRARGLNTDTLLLEARDASLGAPIRFLAISFVSGAVDRSDETDAEMGAVYHWQLGPQRGYSSLWQQRANDGDVALQASDSTKICRAPGCRSSVVRNRFMRLTGHRTGWPGHVVDHMHPLECGGGDVLENLMWQTIAEAAAKDRLETQCGRWLPSLRSDGKPVPNAPIP